MKSISKLLTLFAVITALCITATVTNAAFVTYSDTVASNVVPDCMAWQAAAGTTEAFPFTPANLALADEVAVPPVDGNGAGMGTGLLTFNQANTGLSTSFAIAGTSGTPNWRYFCQFGRHCRFDCPGQRQQW